MLMIDEMMDIFELAGRMTKPRGGWPAWNITETDAISARDLLIGCGYEGQDFDSLSDEDWQEVVGDAVVRSLCIELPMTAWAAVLSGLHDAKQKLAEDDINRERLQMAGEIVSEQLAALEVQK